MGDIREEIDVLLSAHASEKVRQKTQYYFKEDVNTYGVRAAKIHEIGKQIYTQLKDLPTATLFQLATELWQTKVLEHGIIAGDWAYYTRRRFQPSDFEIFSSWILNYIDNWATCDGFCTRALGYFLLQYPEYLSELNQWTKSDRLWMRRAAAVSLIPAARKDQYLDQALRLADLLLHDEEDLVQKGYGWMLKAYSKPQPQVIFDFVLARKDHMPRTALRYAIEKLPEPWRKMAMER